MLTILDIRSKNENELLDLPRPDLLSQGDQKIVEDIIDEVKIRKDAALFDLTEKFDGVRLSSLLVTPEEVQKGKEAVSPALLTALTSAAASIAKFHRHRSPLPDVYENNGISVKHMEIPVESAGVYVPGGKAKYPSSVLMTVIPAKVAGVNRIVCCTPPNAEGKVAPEILAACAIAEVDEVYCIGGAQAIAAMAYGTESIKAVDVICGPGSKLVSIAQSKVRSVVGVPSAFAGPSEVVVVADETTPASWAAMDLLVQAEHGPDGLSWLITDSEEKAKEINAEIERLIPVSPRRSQIESTLAKGGYVVIAKDLRQGVKVVNEIAPEHLELMTEDPEALLPYIRNAGAIFMGNYAPATVGDYMAGPSHVLPTFRTAKFASVLGVEDFIRRMHAISFTDGALEEFGPYIAEIASAEGLEAHRESVMMRIKQPTWSQTDLG
ncbi:MAG: histidinol dehydrogenase [Firmicutes bacterium]|nr:histidinol dehydrogenase [Bacillota bacterium]